jgi:hypothetical protein
MRRRDEIVAAMNSHPCKSQLHLGADLLSAGEAGGVTNPEQSETSPLYRLESTKAEQVKRCRREVESCTRARADPNLTPAQKLGAMQGEVDWLVALQMVEEDNPSDELIEIGARFSCDR